MLTAMALHATATWPAADPRAHGGGPPGVAGCWRSWPFGRRAAAGSPTSRPPIRMTCRSRCWPTSASSEGSPTALPPDATVSRQQFAKMVVVAMRIPVSEADVSAFGDVPRTGPETSSPTTTWRRSPARASPPAPERQSTTAALLAGGRHQPGSGGDHDDAGAGQDPCPRRRLVSVGLG